MTEADDTHAALEVIAGRPAPEGTRPDVVRRADKVRDALGGINALAPLDDTMASELLARAAERAHEIVASAPDRNLATRRYAIAATVASMLFGGIWLARMSQVIDVRERGAAEQSVQELHLDIADPRGAAERAARELTALGIEATAMDADGLWELRVTVAHGQEATVAAHLQSATPPAVKSGALLVIYRLKLD